MQVLTRDQRDALAELITDPDELKFIRAFMRIPNKQRQDVPLNPWPVQERLIRGMTGRNVTVKDTQCGSTSIYTAVFSKRTITHPNTTTVIMAHDEFTTGRLLHRAQVMYDSVPAPIKPRQDHSSNYEMRFPDINSVMYISTARAAVAGRGEPIHNLLLSEAAFYQPGTRERIVIPALQRVPPDGTVVIESTPCGQDELVYAEVRRILQGVSAFTLQVVYCWDNPDNILPPSSPLVPKEERGDFRLTGEEEALVAVYKVSRDFLRWRRWKVREAGDLYLQEHLESLDTCFLVTGSPYYPTEPVLRLTQGCYTAPHTGPGGAQVWYPPEERGSYVMGIDPGQGKMTESVCSVWRVWAPTADEFRGPQHVATLSGLWDASERHSDIVALGKWYNWALINPEANGHGQGLIRELKNYPRLHFREDIVSGVKSMQIGWLTTGRTKPYMMQTLKRLLPTVECHDAELLTQLQGFRDIGLGKVLPSTMDDHHDAACLALVALEDAGPRVRGYRGSSGFTTWDK